MNTKPDKFSEYNWTSSLGLQGISTLHHLGAWGQSRALLMDSIKLGNTSLLRLDPEQFWIPTRLNTFLTTLRKQDFHESHVCEENKDSLAESGKGDAIHLLVTVGN